MVPSGRLGGAREAPFGHRSAKPLRFSIDNIHIFTVTPRINLVKPTLQPIPFVGDKPGKCLSEEFDLPEEEMS